MIEARFGHVLKSWLRFLVRLYYIYLPQKSAIIADWSELRVLRMVDEETEGSCEGEAEQEGEKKDIAVDASIQEIVEELKSMIVKESVQNYLKNIVKDVEKSREEMEDLKVRCCRELLQVFLPEFPEAELEVYGSSASGLARRASDLDLHLRLGPPQGAARRWLPDLCRAAPCTRRVAALLRRHARYSDAQAVTDTKMPIVTLTDTGTGIKCDLNTASRIGVLNTRFVRFCADQDPRAREVMLVVKDFCAAHGLTGSGRGDHLSNYGLTLLVVAFLQERRLLHPLHALQQVAGLGEELVEGHNFAMCTDASRLPPLPTCHYISNFAAMKIQT